MFRLQPTPLQTRADHGDDEQEQIVIVIITTITNNKSRNLISNVSISLSPGPRMAPLGQDKKTARIGRLAAHDLSTREAAPNSP